MIQIWILALRAVQGIPKRLQKASKKPPKTSQEASSVIDKALQKIENEAPELENHNFLASALKS